MDIPPRLGSLPSRRLRDEVGATMVEYGLMIAFVALLAATGAAVLGGGVHNTLTRVASVVTGETAAGDPLPPQLPVPEEEAGSPAGDGGPAAASKSGPNANAANGAKHSSGQSAHNK